MHIFARNAAEKVVALCHRSKGIGLEPVGPRLWVSRIDFIANGNGTIGGRFDGVGFTGPLGAQNSEGKKQEDTFC